MTLESQLKAIMRQDRQAQAKQTRQWNAEVHPDPVRRLGERGPDQKPRKKRAPASPETRAKIRESVIRAQQRARAS